MFKPGDKVICIDAAYDGGCDLAEGGIYTVIRVSDEYVYLNDGPDGPQSGGYCHCRFRLFGSSEDATLTSLQLLGREKNA